MENRHSYIIYMWMGWIIQCIKLDLPPCARNRPAFSAFATVAILMAIAGHNKLTTVTRLMTRYEWMLHVHAYYWKEGNPEKVNQQSEDAS